MSQFGSWGFPSWGQTRYKCIRRPAITKRRPEMSESTSTKFGSQHRLGRRRAPSNSKIKDALLIVTTVASQGLKQFINSYLHSKQVGESVNIPGCRLGHFLNTWDSAHQEHVTSLCDTFAWLLDSVASVSQKLGYPMFSHAIPSTTKNALLEHHQILTRFRVPLRCCLVSRFRAFRESLSV